MDEFLRDILKAAIPSTAIDWGYTAQGIRPPRIVLYRISGRPDYTMSGASGLAEARVQIDCYSQTQAGAKTLAASVKAALSGRRTGLISAAFLDAERDLPPDTDGGSLIARVSLDFIIHHQEG